MSWHSLEGLRDGLITMLSETSFDGRWSDAHNYADFIGDIVGIMEWNTTMVDQWYVPINDIHNIFIEYYGDDRGITPNLISTCSLMLLAGRIAEQELGAVIYPVEIIRAPLFLDILQDYYLGGINDMAAWTQIVWDTSLEMATQGTEHCHIVKNPLEIYCNDTKANLPTLGAYPYQKVKEQKENHLERIKMKLGIETTEDFLDFAEKHIEMDLTGKGVQFNVNQIHFGDDQETESIDDEDTIEPFATFTIPYQYADFGTSLHITDIDQDGNDDLLVGAPGYQELGSRAVGCVFIYTSWTEGSENDFQSKVCASDHNYGSVTDYSRFGHSIATFNWNSEGQALIIGAPSSGSETLDYLGGIHFFRDVGMRDGTLHWRHHEFLRSAENAMSYGANLAAWNEYLMISGPHFSSDYRQVGSVFLTNGTENIPLPFYFGEDKYSWTGQSVQPLDSGRIAVSSHLAKVGGVNIAGYITILNENLERIERIYNPFIRSDQFGYAMVSTNLTIDGSNRACLLVGAPTSTYGFHTNAGSVMIFDADTYLYLGKMDADRALGRFGRTLEVSNDKLYIGAPRYHEEANALREEGAVFVMSLAKSLPLDTITENCSENSHIPCLKEWMDLEINAPFGQKRSLFGHQIKSFQRGQDNYVAISAPRSSLKANYAGAVYLYKNL